MLHHSPRTWLAWLPLVLACSQAGDAPAVDVELGTSSSTSGTGEPPPTSTPTSSPTATTESSTTHGSTGLGDSNTSAGDTSTSTDGASSTGDAPLMGCGNGEIDPGEECDLGLVENSDSTSDCTIECKTAKCGDGLVHIGKEMCDNGASNNNTLYGGCMQNCEFGPRCNDGIVQDSEECDLGNNNGSGEFSPDGVPCDDGCRYQARLVFLSSVAYKGGEIGGVEGAHTKCQILAEKAGYDNSKNFMAWLSDALHSPAKDFLHTAGLPFVRPDGVRIADDWNDLVKNGPHDGIFVTEKGEHLLNAVVWTGTTASGTLLAPELHCTAWTSLDPAGSGRVGRSGVDKGKQPAAWDQWYENQHWTNFSNYACEDPLPIYCFEQLSETQP